MFSRFSELAVWVRETRARYVGLDVDGISLQAEGKNFGWLWFPLLLRMVFRNQFRVRLRVKPLIESCSLQNDKAKAQYSVQKCAKSEIFEDFAPVLIPTPRKLSLGKMIKSGAG